MIPSAVYFSIDDVVPIDPDKAGKSFADYLHDFGQITFFALIALAILGLIVAVIVAKKAGYSGWWGAIGVLFPPVGLVLVLLFALFKWPSLKERDEALGILAANDLTLPSHERKAIKEADRKHAIEDAARKRMEKAQVDREKADVERARFAASEAKRASDVSAAAAAAAIPAAGASGASTKPAASSAKSTAMNGDAKPDGPSSAKVEPGGAQAPTTSEPDKSSEAAPTSVAPNVRTVRPSTSTNPTTGSDTKDAAAPPEA